MPLTASTAHPASFRALLKETGAVLRGERAYPDHHDYGASDLDWIRGEMKRIGAEMVVTTEKDAGKMTPWLAKDEPVWALRVELDIMDGKERFEQVLAGKTQSARTLAEAHA